MKIKLLLILFFLNALPTKINAASFEIELTIPSLDISPYHKPYVAVWLETLDRKPVHTFVFWREQSDWFKDLRQWWRKVGRAENTSYDAVSGATRKPGTYLIEWQAQALKGDYVLHFEAVREQGSREYLKQKLKINLNLQQSYVLQGKSEFGEIKIKVDHE